MHILLLQNKVWLSLQPISRMLSVISLSCGANVLHQNTFILLLLKCLKIIYTVMRKMHCAVKTLQKRKEGGTGKMSLSRGKLNHFLRLAGFALGTRESASWKGPQLSGPEDDHRHESENVRCN